MESIALFGHTDNLPDEGLNARFLSRKVFTEQTDIVLQIPLG
jgi:hypothetical protein